MVGTLNQSEGGVRGGVCGGVRGGVHRGCAEGCAQRVHGGCMEVFQRGGGEKNKDFMFIRFLNAAI